MNIVNFAIDNELLGARSLGTKNHQHLRSSFQSFSNPNIATSFSNSICDLRELSNQNHFTSKLPLILRENEFDLSKTNLNKIFTAQWLDDRKVIMGTKCNKIVLLDTITGKHSIQAPLKSHRASRNIQNHCGIHSISINPSRTLLATGAEHVNDIAIYSLPSMEPVSVGYNAHTYWIFDIVWLDDDHVVSGAGDNKLALWSMNTSGSSCSQSEQNLFKSMGSFINKKISSSPSGTSSSLPNSFHAAGSSYTSTNNRPTLNRSWSSHNIRVLKQNTRFERRNLKRPSPSSPSSSIMSTNRFRSPIVARSPYFHNFYASNSPRTNPRASTSASSNFSQNLPTSLSQPNYLPSQSTNTSGSHRHRFNFRFDSSQQTTSIYNINGNRGSSNRGSISAQSRINTSNIGITTRSPLTRGTAFDDFQDNDSEINENNYENEEDEQEEDDNENAFTDDSFNSTNNDLDENNDFDESFEMTTDENETSLTQSSVNNDDDEEDSDDDIRNGIDHDLNEDEEIFEYNKRRRLNSLGGFQASQGVKYMKSSKVIKCKQSKRIRALAFNPRRNEIAAISMNAAFHYFDVNRFEQKYTKKLSPLKENVCLTINDNYDIYAIGSASHVQLLDADSARPLTNPIFIKKDIGVRSLHFRNNVLSIGTGIGTVLFYDVRAHKFLNKNNTCDNNLKLQTTGGWILRNETYYDTLPYAFNTDNSHAIYSHSYDPTGTKLLTVGGPLTVNLYGHYAGLWS